MSSPFVQLRPGFRALILQGAGAAQLGGGYILDETRSNPALRVAMPMGRADQNWEETITMSGALTDGARLRVFPFSGTHT
ncbi:MAG: hypothetical protein A2087_14700 [Spirochaetes bacterium GWD1_61_31]|nr:MAG: hypothetical protein A2087_14700 [Spirochaetes bacterium GWD1_61_31]HAX38041.1 hypothetical protein [Spirochaetaceae bacterium]HCQ87698.1 hypothetical protein [Spirochaetaceae bacterium]